MAETPDNGGSRPVPDPTVLTTELIDRAVLALKSYVDSQNAVQDERLRGIDQATALRIDTIHSIIPDVEAKILYERRLTDERLASVAQQFKERDTRSERESRDNKLAVDAAFAAQEKQAAAQNKSNAEAIGKSEAATKEAADKAEQLNRATAAALTDKIDDVKTRLGIIDATLIGVVQKTAGGKEAVTDSRATVLFGISVIVFLISLGTAVIGLAVGK